ncbi:uncharacterized protein LOC125517597 isoform X3 [Triticum urartu]|uniref:uncharacterized protein LOC125517597 isoform X3 n=1 Tax=Triticum urartu TaxID=4572 RepID=UPI0020443DD6|nr:uncharacterized protein LOC125517597 isoform X3 [Triticum urartu]
MRACIRDDSGPPPDDERKGGSERAAERRGAAAMATTLSLSSPLFLATPPRARHVVSAGPSWSTANLPCKGHFAGMRRQGRKQHRSTPIVSLFGRKTAKKTTRETVVPDPDYRLPIAILGELWRDIWCVCICRQSSCRCTCRPTGAASLVSGSESGQSAAGVRRKRVCWWQEPLEVLNICELGTMVAAISYPSLLQRDPNKTRRPNSFLPSDFQRPTTL